jgi:hypothetical protein
MNIVLAMSLAAAALDPALPAFEHRTSIEHAGRAVDAEYRARVLVTRRQIGSAPKSGMPSTLRCVWSADISLERHASVGPKVRLSRAFGRDGVIEGNRAGWCSMHDKAIAREVAKRAGEIEARAIALAREDEAVLRAELDDLNGGGEG